jgi:MFS family permease
MLGYIVDAALIDVRPTLNWRLMLGSTVIAPILVCAQVYFCPESPRWYLKKNRPRDAYHSFLRLRPTKLQAARDLYYAHVNLEIEASLKRGRNLVWEMFSVPRNRRAALASWIVMFMQQFCGVNVIAYYSSVIFVQDGGFSERTGILASLGAGIINWLFALPAVYTIDTFGRRNLLLTTFPLMSLFLFFTGSAFYIPEGTGRIACVALGIYLFMVVYSPGEGPVPFVYSSEAYPLRVRDIGMSFATGTSSSESLSDKSYHVVLQFCFVNYVAVVERFIHHLRGILLVRCLEHRGMVARAAVCTGDEGSHIGGIGSSVFSPYKETCRVSIGSSEALV